VTILLCIIYVKLSADGHGESAAVAAVAGTGRAVGLASCDQ